MADKFLRVLITKEEDMLVAQCLEHDICVQAVDMETLKHRFECVMELEAADGGLAIVAPAPELFHEKWEAAQAMQSELQNAEVRLAA